MKNIINELELLKYLPTKKHHHQSNLYDGTKKKLLAHFVHCLFTHSYLLAVSLLLLIIID